MRISKAVAHQLIVRWALTFAPYRQKWLEMEPVFAGIERYLRQVVARQQWEQALKETPADFERLHCAICNRDTLFVCHLWGVPVVYKFWVLLKCTTCERLSWIPQEEARGLPPMPDEDWNQ